MYFRLVLLKRPYTGHLTLSQETAIPMHALRLPCFLHHFSCRATLLLTGWLCLTLHAAAQVEQSVAAMTYELDSADTRALRLEVDNLSFFKDNEFSGTVMKGYSLPGLWVTPKLTYQPLPNLKVEAGVHALIYSGAYKFPNYAYHDIAKWKGSQYQQGAHVLPWFRGQLALKRVNLILGDLYGGTTHRLAAPLYNPEMMLTADPEFGFQLLLDTRPVHLDVWLNWESFIFEGDTHQEEFIVGLSSRLRLNRDSARIHAYVPLQATIQHRGGEQDTAASVQTLANGAVGLGAVLNLRRGFVRNVTAECLLLGYTQQAGNIWPFGSGSALYARVEVGMRHGLKAHAGYFRGNHFISLLGIPYFGAVSTKNEGACYPDHPTTFHLGLDYSRQFGKRYAFGAKVETYCNKAGTIRYADGTEAPTSTTFNTTFGVYLRINPSFLLKKW